MAITTFAGHPLHPQLIAAPTALLPFSFIQDLLFLATGRRAYADGAYQSMLGGYIGGLAAAAAGAADYFSIPSRTRAKKTANLHAVLNLGVMGLYSVNLLLRANGAPRALEVLLSGIGTAGLFASAWYGGHLVYQLGMRVTGVDPVAGARELKLPGDARLEGAFETALDRMAPEEEPATLPERGPRGAVG